MNPRKEERNKLVLEKRRQGMTYKELCEEFGLCKSRLFYIIQNQERLEREGEAE